MQILILYIMGRSVAVCDCTGENLKVKTQRSTPASLYCQVIGSSVTEKSWDISLPSWLHVIEARGFAWRPFVSACVCERLIYAWEDWNREDIGWSFIVGQPWRWYHVWSSVMRNHMKRLMEGGICGPQGRSSCCLLLSCVRPGSNLQRAHCCSAWHVWQSWQIYIEREREKKRPECRRQELTCTSKNAVYSLDADGQ